MTLPTDMLDKHPSQQPHTRTKRFHALGLVEFLRNVWETDVIQSEGDVILKVRART